MEMLNSVSLVLKLVMELYFEALNVYEALHSITHTEKGHR